MKPDSHASDAPIHLVRNWRKIKLTCRPDIEPPPMYRASQNIEIVTCEECKKVIQTEIESLNS